MIRLEICSIHGVPSAAPTSTVSATVSNTRTTIWLRNNFTQVIRLQAHFNLQACALFRLSVMAPRYVPSLPFSSLISAFNSGRLFASYTGDAFLFIALLILPLLIRHYFSPSLHPLRCIHPTHHPTFYRHALCCVISTVSSLIASVLRAKAVS